MSIAFSSGASGPDLIPRLGGGGGGVEGGGSFSFCLFVCLFVRLFICGLFLDLSTSIGVFS